jgi:hypothetical protein
VRLHSTTTDEAELRTNREFRAAVDEVIDEVASLDLSSLAKPSPPPYSRAHHQAAHVSPDVLVETLETALKGKSVPVMRAVLARVTKNMNVLLVRRGVLFTDAPGMAHRRLFDLLWSVFVGVDEYSGVEDLPKNRADYLCSRLAAHPELSAPARAAGCVLASDWSGTLPELLSVAEALGASLEATLVSNNVASSAPH